MGCSKNREKFITTEKASNEITQSRCCPKPNNNDGVSEECIYKNDCECQSKNTKEVIDSQWNENIVCLEMGEQKDKNSVILSGDTRNNLHENAKLAQEISELQNILNEIHKQLAVTSGLRDFRRKHESHVSKTLIKQTKTNDRSFERYVRKKTLEQNKERNVRRKTNCETFAEKSYENRFKKKKRFVNNQLLLKKKRKKHQPQKNGNTRNKNRKQKMTMKKGGNRNFIKTPLWLYDLRAISTDLCITLYPVHGNHQMSASSLDPLFQSINEGETSSQNGGMNFEWIRLRTFASFNYATSQRPIVLSRIGFYYTGRENEVKCYSCGATYNNWSPQDDPLQIHHQISPHCRHLAGTDERNVSVGHRDISSRSSIANSLEVNSDLNAMQQNNANTSPGLHNYLPRQDAASSQQSQINRQISFSSDTSTPTSNRNNLEPNQERTSSAVNDYPRRIENRTDNNQMTALPSTLPEQSRSQQVNPTVSSATINKLSPLGVNFDKPRYPQYAVLTVRMSTYNGWPATQIPRKMAEAGFIYAGYADYARCFFCGGGLRNWEDGDDPWIEHARWFPRCAYVRQNKGDHFVHLVHERLHEMLRAEGNMDTPSNQNRESQGIQLQNNYQDQKQYESELMANGSESQLSADLKDLPSYQSVLELGYASDMIENTIKYLLREGRKDITSNAILQILFKIEEGDNSLLLKVKANTRAHGNVNNTAAGGDTDDEEFKKIIEENRRLKELKACMICKEKDSCVTFLPCGHLVCCEECAPAMRKCPRCQQAVQGSIKTWLV